MIRASTLGMLLKYHTSPQSLGDALSESLKQDALNSVNPILLDPHFKAIDKRVGIILQVCIYHYIYIYIYIYILYSMLVLYISYVDQCYIFGSIR